MKSTTNIFPVWAIVVFTLILSPTPIQARTQAPQIHNLEVDSGRVTFDAYLQGNPTDTITALPLDDFFILNPYGIPTPMETIANQSKDTLKVYGQVPSGIFPGDRKLTILYQGDTVFSNIMKIPNPLTGVGQQPLILNISPEGTAPGRVVTIKGRGFGNDLDNIYVWFSRNNGDLLPRPLAHVLNPTAPTYLTSPDPNGIQELKFILPGRDRVDEKDDAIESDSWLEYELRLRVVVQGQPSANSEILSIVTQHYRTILLLLVLGIFAGITIGIWALSVYLRRRGFKGGYHLRYFVIDQTTNRLSLSKCQALAWTIVLVISYTYYVLMTFMIFDKSVIPDFDPSLLILMGITTSGLMIARSQDKSKQNKAAAAGTLKVEEKPSLWNLITEGGSINLASLQLVMFTIVGIGVYIVYMTSPNLVETGLPTMPDTLLALMGISQGGYVTGKAVEGNGEGQAQPQTLDEVKAKEEQQQQVDNSTTTNAEASKPATEDNPQANSNKEGDPGEKTDTDQPKG